MSTASTPLLPAPQQVRIAHWLYIVSAILGLIGIVVGVIALPATVQLAEEQARAAAQGQNTGGVDLVAATQATVLGLFAASVVFALVFSVLTIVFARKMVVGRNWARITLAVFAVLQIIGVGSNYGVGLIHFLLALVALILSFLPVSNAWFRAVKPGRSAF